MKGEIKGTKSMGRASKPNISHKQRPGSAGQADGEEGMVSGDGGGGQRGRKGQGPEEGSTAIIMWPQGRL